MIGAMTLELRTNRITGVSERLYIKEMTWLNAEKYDARIRIEEINKEIETLTDYYYEAKNYEEAGESGRWSYTSTEYSAMIEDLKREKLKLEELFN